MPMPFFPMTSLSGLVPIALSACVALPTLSAAAQVPPTLESHCPFVPAWEQFQHADSQPKDHWGAVLELGSEIVGPKITGRKRQYVVKAPSVRRAQTSYPGIAVHPGDIVRARACGCVQTGGSGKTWKRYANPQGPNSDRMYHGLIGIGSVHFIPGTGPAKSLDYAAGTFFRIDSWTSFQQSGGKAFATEAMPLSLGYEDDNYDDNGYWGFDAGTDGQCRNEGVAVVEIHIERTMGDLENDIDRHGGDISSTPKRTDTAGQCAALCAINASCRSMTFVEDHAPSGGACWLKRSVPEQRLAEGGVSAIKITN